MPVIELNENNFTQIVNNNNIVIVDFWAPWCGPCKNFAPIYEQVATENPDIIFAKVNTEVEQGIAANFQIRSIPTLMIFQEQIIVFSQPGAVSAPDLNNVIVKCKALDMDEVRKQVKQQN